ncbi:hypothetical protein L3X38_000440 [Prunus dulcis]|uniref:Uncharacterized protein n=1 Tax=Prunus dulcis TaxID=3755 RepID=A0AAD4WQ43_PRUDU|nr:hypothetical protein L3X38_000440 [Prunus dulcis]
MEHGSMEYSGKQRYWMLEIKLVSCKDLKAFNFFSEILSLCDCVAEEPSVRDGLRAVGSHNTTSRYPPIEYAFSFPWSIEPSVRDGLRAVSSHNTTSRYPPIEYAFSFPWSIEPSVRDGLRAVGSHNTTSRYPCIAPSASKS